MAEQPPESSSSSMSSNGPSPPGVWRFGEAVLDERIATLRVAGTGIELDRSSYDVLLALLRHAGEVVTKDELLETGWPGRVVSENSLAKAIGRLRQALGEDGAAIRVVHGYGYRLAAAVRFEAVPVEKVVAHPHDAERLREGDRLPHRPGWRLLRRLGEGSAGVIHLAQSDSGDTRAIKLATSEGGLRSLKREIALARYIQAVRADLPGVAPVLGWNLAQPPFFLEMPFYPHGHLRDWALAQGGLIALSFQQRLSLCVQLVRGGGRAARDRHPAQGPQAGEPVPGRRRRRARWLAHRAGRPRCRRGRTGATGRRTGAHLQPGRRQPFALIRRRPAACSTSPRKS